jgi:hypothetical protein
MSAPLQVNGSSAKKVTRWMNIIGEQAAVSRYKFKAELIKDIQSQHRLLEKTIAILTHDQMNSPEVVGTWSVKDILAHLTEWEKRFLSLYRMSLDGEGCDDNAWLTGREADALNQKFYDKNRLKPLDEVINDFHHSFQEILTVIISIPEREFFSVGVHAWTGKRKLVDFITGTTVLHYSWARKKIKTAFNL